MTSLYILVSLFASLREISACDCPNAWTVYSESCYVHGHDDGNFLDSEMFCQHRGGHLVHIDDAAENMFVKSFVDDLSHDKFWIGLTDRDTEGQWLWYDTDQPASFLDWKPGQPDAGTSDNCAAMFGDAHYQWVDQNCAKLFRPICEKPCSNEGSSIVG